MKIELPENFQLNFRDFLRRCGYATIVDSHSGRLSFVKRLTSDHYPRFHVYIEKSLDAKTFLTIHLDQKKASYEGHTAHMGEYSGPLVEEEAKNLKQKIFSALEYTRPPETSDRFSLFKNIFKKNS